MAKVTPVNLTAPNSFGETVQGHAATCACPLRGPSALPGMLQDQPVKPEDHFARYASGELDPKIKLSWRGGLAAPLSAPPRHCHAISVKTPLPETSRADELFAHQRLLKAI